MPALRSPKKPPRIASVDAIRGFSVFWLLGGEGAAHALDAMLRATPLRPVGAFIGTQFTHVDWIGFRFWDFVFPLLVFISGVSIVYSLTKAVEGGDRADAYVRIVRRFLLLFVLGLLFYGGFANEWPEIRLTGVLQRIALCYLFASLLFMNLQWRGLAAVTLFILIGYWALMTFVPVPGVGPANFQPDTNLAHWLDAQILPGEKLGGEWDPEGILSTVPAIATCLIGVLCGILLRDERVTPMRKAAIFWGGGAVMVILGWLWGLQFPIIKSIWTSTYVLVCAGFGAMMLGALYVIMDIWGRKAWAAVFIWIGGNALALYFFNGVFGFEPFAKRLTGGDISAFLDRVVAEGTGRFVTHIMALTVASILAAYLYRRRIFIRV